MLTALLSTALAVFMALVWMGACLLPLLMVWGLWMVFKSHSATLAERESDALDAFLDESDAFMVQFQAEQAARTRRLQHL
jgi:hypothetical protein